MTEFKTINLGQINDYALKASDGYLLIDTCPPGMYRKLVSQLEKAGIKVTDVRYLLITHTHVDHVGAAAEFLKNSDARLIYHKEAKSLLEQGTSKLGTPTSMLAKLLLSLIKPVYQPVPLKNSDLVLESDDNTFLRNIGIDGKILVTQGHTPDSISVLLDDGSAFIGDAAGNMFSSKMPVVYDNLEEVYYSWDYLAQSGAKILYPGHGKPFTIEQLMEENEKKKHKENIKK